MPRRIAAPGGTRFIRPKHMAGRDLSHNPETRRVRVTRNDRYRAMPVSDLSDAEIDAVYATISKAHGLKILKADRRARLLEQEQAGKISIEVVFGEIFITSPGGRMLRLPKLDKTE
jgi:hypothetical protein